MSRIVETAQAIEVVTRGKYPEADVKRCYTPEKALAKFNAYRPTVFVLIDAIEENEENSSRTKWLDSNTMTIAVCKKIRNIENNIPEMDELMEMMEQLRNEFRARQEGNVMFVRAVHTPSRPVFVKRELELRNTFIGFLLIYADVPGILRRG